MEEGNINQKYTSFLCEKLNNEEKIYDEGEDFSSYGKSTSMIDFFNGSCTLINKNHRVLIKKEYPYRFYLIHIEQTNSK